MRHSPSGLEIVYDVSMLGPVSLKIYDLAGKLVRTLVEEKKAPGIYRIVWDYRTDGEKHLPAGIYLLRLKMNSTITTKAIIIK